MSMKMIQKLSFDGCGDAAVDLYQRVFGCTVRSLIHYRDAVANGWERACPEKDSEIYHSELLFGDAEVRIADSPGEEAELTRKIEHLIGMDTEAEVERAFRMLSEGGEVIMPLTRPPYMVVIGKVRDPFGVMWTLMCDF